MIRGIRAHPEPPNRRGPTLEDLRGALGSALLVIEGWMRKENG